jgi:hypothetical protein
MFIYIDTISELTEIVAGLVREGLTFEVVERNGQYLITLTGGF